MSCHNLCQISRTYKCIEFILYSNYITFLTLIYIYLFILYDLSMFMLNKKLNLREFIDEPYIMIITHIYCNYIIYIRCYTAEC